MDLGLKDKVAIIGGASKGLGRASAQVLAEEGAKVTICSRTSSDLEKAADEIRESTGAEVLTYAADLDELSSVTGLISATVEHFGGLDILVNNSGGPPLARSVDATEEQWETAVHRSLIFFGRMCREGVPHLRARGGGRIINILASTVYNPIPNLALSGATRMGVVAYSKSLADEVGRDGILVNNVCPGSILSDRMLSNVTSRAKELGISVEDALGNRAKETALGRVGEPVEQIVFKWNKLNLFIGVTLLFLNASIYFALIPNKVIFSVFAISIKRSSFLYIGKPSNSKIDALRASELTNQFHIIQPHVVK